MSAEAAALQQLRGLISALGASELAALSEATVTNLQAAANSVVRLARAGASELARGSWEAALELWCAAPLHERRFAHCAVEAWVATRGWLRCGALVRRSALTTLFSARHATQERGCCAQQRFYGV